MGRCKRRRTVIQPELNQSPCNNINNEDMCRSNVQLLKDCLCCEWSVPPGNTQVVFVTGGFDQIFGSGFISYDEGDADFVTVRFFLNDTQVGFPINVFRDSCVTFTFTNFDRITVSCPGNGSPDNVCEGEICITARFPVGSSD